MCPITGAHFHKADLYQRILKLKKRRALIDRAIEEEHRLKQVAKGVKAETIKPKTPVHVVSHERNKQRQLSVGRQILTEGH
jgi:hypothetical protein